MGKANFDDAILDHPKFERPGPAACWLWFCSTLASRRGKTDGFISDGKIRTVVPGGLPNAVKHAEALVQARLFDKVEGGYVVHDFVQHQPSKAEVEEFQRQDRERKRMRKPSIPDRNPSGIQTSSSTYARAGAECTSVPMDERQDLSGEESAREGEPPVWRQRGGRSAGLVANHVRCLSFASAACVVGMCIPAFLIQREWLPQVQGREADVSGFIASVLSQTPEPKGDPLTFWRDRWSQAHASPRRSSRPSHTPVDPDKYAGITIGDDDGQ